MSDEHIYLEWFTKKDLAESTRPIYKIAAEDYKEFIGKTLSELIDEAEQDEELGLRIRKRNINRYLLGFKSNLEEKGYAPGTLNNKMAAIISFYQAFDIQIPDIRLPKGDICLDKNFKRPPTKKQIQKMINVANARDRALIYLLALSGMGGQEARNLTVGKFLESASEAIGTELNTIDDLFDYEDRVLEEIITLNIVRQKVKYRYQTFIPPEASRAIIAYLKEREYNRNERRHINSLDDPLFVTNKGDPMSRTGVGTAIRRVGQLSGFKSAEWTYCFWRPHGLRKYFVTTIIDKVKNQVLADYLVGHKIDPVRRAYWITSSEELKKNYTEALRYLSIDEIAVKDFQSKEFKDLMDKNSLLEQEMDQIKDKISDFSKYKNIFASPKFREFLEDEIL